ncbi:alpha-glucuronidase [Pedobacter alpinus]|uniref:Alpha-glucuronidase n=1 Tax=Pedobacter alpinus TaxID=1590643 RepID=A0ABW5TU44_9SPHI
MKIIRSTSVILLIIFLAIKGYGNDAHELWLKKQPAKSVVISSNNKSVIVNNAIEALKNGWQGENNARLKLRIVKDKAINNDGFKLDNNQIKANTPSGILYGVYELLRRQQTGENTNSILSNPSYQNRILNHWDNLDGSVERGYAGNSIFWRGEKDLAVTANDLELWKQYAIANASIGINGSAINNVNASPKMLSSAVLQRVKSIADVLRPFGIKTYLSVNFASPAVLGGLKTSDPLNADVIKWWKAKADEIYKLVPDFGGFLVKANSEGEPGPQDFGRNHADGANMMADILKPYGGIVMWRAFVYSPSNKDRALQAYLEFMPFDGKFRDNVIIQVKNGPIDFQPREPFSALFGAMKKTSVMPEFQITQEYLGHSNQLAFLAPMWEETLNSDTYQNGEGSTVAKVTNGSIYNQKYTAIAGVANIGLDSNWCGYNFAQANWYAYGRLAWNDKLKSSQIADEWLKLTFKSEKENADNWTVGFLEPVKKMMLESREAVVNYSMPLGLHHIFAAHHHYGPGPWWAPKNARPDWTPPYYHQADSTGLGFNRTKTGSNAVSQYHEPLTSQLNNAATTPEIYLLWFHHLSWDYKTKSGRKLWDELCYSYDKGVNQVRDFQKTWDKIENYVDSTSFVEMQKLLKHQAFDAKVYSDACVMYFQQFSKRPIPFELERPVYNIEFLQSIDPRLIYQEGGNFNTSKILNSKH